MKLICPVQMFVVSLFPDFFSLELRADHYTFYSIVSFQIPYVLFCFSPKTIVKLSSVMFRSLSPKISVRVFLLEKPDNHFGGK